MKKRLEFVMSPSEYGTVANIVGSEERNARRMADKLMKGDIPKEQVADFLYNTASQLQIAGNILTDL